MRSQHRRSFMGLLCAAALIVGAFISCDSPFEPRGEGERVPIGQVVEDQITADSGSRYSFTANSNEEYVVFLQALQGNVRLLVVDSSQQRLVASVVATPGALSLEQNPTPNFQTPTAGVYQLRVSAFPAGSTARFRFQVYRVNTAPEAVPAEFAFGDTVAGEAIDPMVDADEFFVQGQAGQEVVAVLEAPGSAGSGAVSLVVVDPVTVNLIGLAAIDAGISPPVTTGRFRLPASHEYRFIFRPILSSAYPRYRGPYRFWSYLINRAPEHRAAALPVGSEIRGETIDRAGDVDEFTFEAAAGAEFNVFLQASRAFHLEVAPMSGPALAIVTSNAADTGLFQHATGRFQLAQPGTYIARVEGLNAYVLADTGEYRLYLYPVDRRPEHVPAAIAPGDTLTGEDIDLPGDVDEFTFSGAVGQEFNAFLQAQSGSAETYLQLEVVDGTGTVLRTAQSIGTNTSLLGQPTGRFALPSAGIYRLRVSGLQSRNDHDGGAYRLFLYPVNRRPETLPETLAFGDSLSGEAIDVPGDVDEFLVTVADTSGANLLIELGTQPAEGTLLSAQLIESSTGQLIAGASTFTAGVPTASGRLKLSPGTYILRVDVSQYQERPVLRGSYRLWLYRFSFGPESVRDTLVVGDTVSGEALDPPGDEDVFKFYGVRGQHITVAVQGLSAPSNGGFEAFITGPREPPEADPIALVVSPTSGPNLGDHQTLRLDLPRTGWYRISVSGASSPEQLTERGAYGLAVTAVGTAPEAAGSALAPGDSVTTESIDTPGDWDEYDVTATPGEELGLLFQSSGSLAAGFPWILAFNPATGDSLTGTVGQFERFAGPFRVPSSGHVSIAVFDRPTIYFRQCYDALCSGVFRFVGGYQYHVIRVNRAPESTPAAYAVDDTVRGEAITPVGDVDEFTSSGTPGETLTPFYRLTANPVPAGKGITLEVIDPATGDTLAGKGVQLVGTSQEFLSSGFFHVPTSGTFLIRVRGSGTFGDDVATAPYEFFMKR